MKQNLSKEQIQFIDNYLKKSDVRYTDIRMEMVDHVASEIEERMNHGDIRDFYYIFKDFMVEHKAIMIKESNRYYKVSDKRILKKLFRKSFSIKGVVFLFAVFFGFRITGQFMETEQFVSVVNYAPFCIMLFVAIAYIVLTRITKERYSSLERVGFYFFGISQILYYFHFFLKGKVNYLNGNLLALEICSSLIIFALITLILSSFELKKEYQQNYKTFQ